MAPAAIVPPLAAIDVAPLAGGQEPPSVPQLVDEGAVELLTVTPTGRVSLSVKLVNEVSAGAVKVSRKREFPKMLIVLDVKVFVEGTPCPSV